MLGTVLVTGASGLLGFNFVLHAAKRNAKTIALYHSHPLKLPGVLAQKIDLKNGPLVKKLIVETKPEWIVHCAALTQVDWCETHRNETWRLNVETVRQLASVARELEVGMVYVSTDSVFNGELGGYSEESPPTPLNVYAESKLAGERAALEELDQSLIVRTNFYGWNLQSKESLAEWILHKLETGQTVPGFYDISFTPILANDLSEIILDMMERKLKGVFHVSGSQTCSKYEFAQQVARVFGLDQDLVQRIAVADSNKLMALRPKNTSLRTDKISAVFGKKMPDVEAGLGRFKALRSSAIIRKNQAGMET